MTRVLVVDDNPKDRERIAALIDQIDGVTCELARSGAEALQRLETDSPRAEVVLIDLHMPSMTGLELLDKVVSRFPLIPVMIVTSRSSVESAMEALKRGASYYVPKKADPEEMRDAIAKLISSAHHRQCHAQVLDNIQSHRLEFELQNDRKLIPVVWNMIDDMIRALKLFPANETVRTGVALQEAVTNAMVHGNLEIDSCTREGEQPNFELLVAQRSAQSPFRERRVRIISELTRQQVRFHISDEGPGFDPAKIPDPTLPENLLRASGRGLLLMKHFMDEVCYNEKGNAVTLTKYHQPAPVAAK